MQTLLHVLILVLAITGVYLSVFAELLNFAECYNCKQLEVKCKELLQHRFPLVIKTDQWNFISVQQLSHILSFDDLTLGKSEGFPIYLFILKGHHWLCVVIVIVM